MIALFDAPVVREKLINLMPISGRGSWWPLLRESYTGAWQSNVEVTVEDVLSNPFVYACVRLIATDIGKLQIKLVEEDDDGIWNEVTRQSPFLTFLKKPNHYQTRISFVEQWMFSKLIRGNTYVLKQRDQRGVVIGGYVLDTNKVKVLVAPDASVYYQLTRDDLSGIPGEMVTVPAREIIHDEMTAFYHPLAGLSPILACGVAAMMGLRLQENSTKFFEQGARPSGVLTAPGAISQPTADRLKAAWDTNFSGSNVGKVAILGDGLKYEPMGMTAVDSQTSEQWKATAEAICTAFGVPSFKIGVGPAPAYDSVEAMNLQYYTDCLQAHIEKIELLLDEGLELPSGLGTEFDVSSLMRMDTLGRVEAAEKAIGSGALSINESRREYLDKGPTPGGDTPLLQEQNWPLDQLASRPMPTRTITPPADIPEAPPESMDTKDQRVLLKYAAKAMMTERLSRVA